VTYPGVVEIAHSIDEGATTSVDETEAALRRIDNSKLNAFTLVDADGSARRAIELDGVDRRQRGPLHGVQMAVKDIIDQSGLPTTCGSSFYRYTPTLSATVVQRLEAAGAVIVGRTGLHEFAYGFSSENQWFGPIHNPWDPGTSPGGSSGGSGAAVAAGLVPAALGTDTGGSIRVPAALCGIFGLKVTHGRVPLSGVFPLASSLDTVGPMARSIGDLARVYAAIAGDDPTDPWSVPRRIDNAGDVATLQQLRVGIPVPWALTDIDAPVHHGLTVALDRMSAAGVMVAEVPAPELEPPHLGTESMAPEVASVHRPWFTDHPQRYGTEVAARLEQAMAMSLDDYLEGRRWRAKIGNGMRRALAGFDVLATPTVPAMRKPIGESQMMVNGHPTRYRETLSRLTALVNNAGLPALAMPIAVTGQPPPSIQLIGTPWSETKLLGIGAALEAAGIVTFTAPGSQ
jgi:Asp-tRNA(Asn)/Glu-tRNA(Gln) amidotransferase A subunit family amidase